MPTNDYAFLTHWRARATAQEVSDTLGDALSLPRWWPAVYLAVDEVEPGEPNGVGRVIALHTRGWLPYTLRWSFRVSASREPHGFTLEAWGDFVGEGVWTFAQDSEFVDITYDWRISAEKPLLRRFSRLLRPVFAANHRWAMARGEESLRLELARRRTASDAEAASIANPPGAPNHARFALIAGSLTAVVLGLARLRPRR